MYPDAKLAFTRLRQAFPDASGVLSQLTSDASGRWHPVALGNWIRDETREGELLAIVQAFRTWRHYLEGCKHEGLMLTDHNNLRRFMDMKSLSCRQVGWAQELYNFRIDYPSSTTSSSLTPLHQILICATHALP